jgi:hypothetical protein
MLRLLPGACTMIGLQVGAPSSIRLGRHRSAPVSHQLHRPLPPSRSDSLSLSTCLPRHPGMSQPQFAFYIVGNLGLSNGHVVPHESKPGKKYYYHQYSTLLPIDTRTAFDAEIRTYAGKNPDDNTSFLDAVMFASYGFDIDSPTYEDNVPSWGDNRPHVFVVGHVVSPATQVGEASLNCTGFFLETSDYIINSQQASTIQ